MKIKFLKSLVIFFFLASAANAQINEGRYLLGGSISYSNIKNPQNNSSKSEYLNSNIQLGKVITGNTVVGILASYGFTHGEMNYKSDNMGAGIFYRKYRKLLNNFYFFGEADATYNYSKVIQGVFQPGSDGYKQISNGGSISFVPGISYSIFKRMQIELSMQNIFSIGYNSIKTETTNGYSGTVISTKGNGFGASANFDSNLLTNFGVGFKFFLGK